MLPELVIYHELRDFGPSLRDKIFGSVKNPEPPKLRDFGELAKITVF